MKKTICDSCGKEFTEHTRRFNGSAHLILNNQTRANLPFDFEILVCKMNFCTTNLDFCGPCVFEAIKKSIQEV